MRNFRRILIYFEKNQKKIKKNKSATFFEGALQLELKSNHNSPATPEKKRDSSHPSKEEFPQVRTSLAFIFDITLLCRWFQQGPVYRLARQVRRGPVDHQASAESNQLDAPVLRVCVDLRRKLLIMWNGQRITRLAAITNYACCTTTLVVCSSRSLSDVEVCKELSHGRIYARAFAVSGNAALSETCGLI